MLIWSKRKMVKILDNLVNTSFDIYQYDDMFKYNTDTVILADFATIRKKDVVLDIGTNNGALLLYASLRTNNKLIGVEIQPRAAALALENLKINNIVNEYEIICSDIDDVILPLVDCILANPPYFPIKEKSKVSKTKELEIAYHETTLDLEKLIKNSSRLLKDKGRLNIVHRASRMIDIIALMHKYQLEPKRLQLVYSANDPMAKSVLIEAHKRGKSELKVLKPLIL